MTFQVKLADIPIEVSAIYDSTRQFCREYLTEEAPVCSVSVRQEDIDYEREKSAKERRGQTEYAYRDNYLETLAVYRKIASGLLDYGILLFHGSAVAVDGECYLFTAASGTGKSTHTRLWRERFGERAVMVNDDKPLLRVDDRGVTVYGTPWDGKHRLSRNMSAPLQGLCILERSQHNQIKGITAREAWPMLMQQSFRPMGVEELHKAVGLVDKLASTASLYRMGCNMEPEAAVTAYEGMRQNKSLEAGR